MEREMHCCGKPYQVVLEGCTVTIVEGGVKIATGKPIAVFKEESTLLLHLNGGKVFELKKSCFIGEWEGLYDCISFAICGGIPDVGTSVIPIQLTDDYSEVVLTNEDLGGHLFSSVLLMNLYGDFGECMLQLPTEHIIVVIETMNCRGVKSSNYSLMHPGMSYIATFPKNLISSLRFYVPDSLQEALTKGKGKIIDLSSLPKKTTSIHKTNIKVGLQRN